MKRGCDVGAGAEVSEYRTVSEHGEVKQVGMAVTAAHAAALEADVPPVAVSHDRDPGVNQEPGRRPPIVHRRVWCLGVHPQQRLPPQPITG